MKATLLLATIILYSNARCNTLEAKEACLKPTGRNKEVGCFWFPNFECGQTVESESGICISKPGGKVNSKNPDKIKKQKAAIEDVKDANKKAKKECVKKAFGDSQALSDTRKVLNAINRQKGDGTDNKKGGDTSMSPLGDDLNKSPCEKWCKAGNPDDAEACSSGCDDAHKSMKEDGGKNRENTCGECPANKQSGFDCQLKMRPPPADMESFKKKLAEEFYGPKNKKTGSLTTGSDEYQMVESGGVRLEVLEHFKNKVGADGLLALGNFICGASQTAPDASAKVETLKEKAIAETPESE